MLKKTGSYYVSQSPTEHAFLVGIKIRGSHPLFPVEDSLEELALLADTAGMNVVGQTYQQLEHVDPSTFVGSGKISEVQQAIEELEASVIIFDDELSPRHQRELDKRFGENVKVLDRSALILDIFAQHAHTKEGALQVELAQYQYRLPRLTRQWTHLARQAGGGGGAQGGIGLRGPGETQLEVDKREIGRRITKLQNDLDQVRRHRNQHRKKRSKDNVSVVALVGYTNAGKSTLLRALTGTNIYTADQLFATLDPTTRKLELPSGEHVVITDTVGFIQKLPTTLIAAFRATLEEIVEADMILHVVDASHPNVMQQIESVEDTLAQIEIGSVQQILVWNKMDLVQSNQAQYLKQDISTAEEYASQVCVSAQEGWGLDELQQAIENGLKEKMIPMQILLPYDRGEMVSEVFENGIVESQKHTAEGVVLITQLPRNLSQKYARFQIEDE